MQSSVLCSEGACEVERLENAPVSCDGDGVLNQFRLARERNGDGTPTGNLRYDFACRNLAVGATTQKQTPFNAVERGNIIYLDRHEVSCQPNEAIKGFRLLNRKTQDGAEIAISYQCQDAGLRYHTIFETPYNSDGNGQSIYLDRHHIRCPANTVLNAFKVVRASDNGQIKYVYRCGEPTRDEDTHLNSFRASIDKLIAEIRRAIHLKQVTSTAVGLSKLAAIFNSEDFLNPQSEEIKEIARQTLRSMAILIRDVQAHKNQGDAFIQRLLTDLPDWLLLQTLQQGDVQGVGQALELNANPDMLSPWRFSGAEKVTVIRAVLRKWYKQLQNPSAVLEMLITHNANLLQNDMSALSGMHIWVGKQRYRFYIENNHFDFVDELLEELLLAISQANSKQNLVHKAYSKTAMEHALTLKKVFETHCSGTEPSEQCRRALESCHWFEVTFLMIEGLSFKASKDASFERLRNAVLDQLLSIPLLMKSEATQFRSLQALLEIQIRSTKYKKRQHDERAIEKQTAVINKLAQNLKIPARNLIRFKKHLTDRESKKISQEAANTNAHN